MQIKFSSLHSLHRKLEKKFLISFKKHLKMSTFIGGHEVAEFEKNFRKINESKFCISCANGSDALVIAIKTLGIKPGDEVITTSLSWIATSAAITSAGGKVVFCDINQNDFNISINQRNKKITHKTVGIIPVHLYGYPVDMPKILKIAKKNKLWVIEDCAQAHLSKISNKTVGNFGDIGTFSFFPGKNLGALGDAGCLVTNKKNLEKKARLIANHGGKGLHLLEGMNSRLDSLQASILNIKLKFLKKQTEARIKNAEIYNNHLSNLKDLKIPKIDNKYKAVFHQYVIKTKKRDKLKIFLKKHGVETQVHYKQSLPAMKAYKYLNLKMKDYSHAITATKEILSLPVSPEKKLKEIMHISKIIKKFLAN